MALDESQPQMNSTVDAADATALNLPVLRVESQFRQETRGLQREERDRYSNYLWNMMRLDMGPRFTIGDLVGPNQDAELQYAHESALNSSVDYYHRKSDHTELRQVLKFYTVYLMQQARKEADPAKQQFLLFKAVDLARMIVQYSPLTANADAEALVFGIMVAINSAYGSQWANYAQREKEIFHLMRRLEVSPQDLQLRLRLGEAMIAQSSYFDALVQYHTLLRILLRRGEQANRQRGWVIARIGDLFQELSQLTAARLRDARKIRTFIERFNRDFAERGRELPRLQAINVAQVDRVRYALMSEANRWHLQAGASPLLDRRLRANLYAKAGRNLNAMGQYKAALRALEEGYPNWRGVRETPGTLREQAEYLKQVTTAAINLKRRAPMAWATRESSEVNGKLAAIDAEQRERDKVRAALLG